MDNRYKQNMNNKRSLAFTAYMDNDDIIDGVATCIADFRYGVCFNNRDRRWKDIKYIDFYKPERYSYHCPMKHTVLTDLFLSSSLKQYISRSPQGEIAIRFYKDAACSLVFLGVSALRMIWDRMSSGYSTSSIESKSIAYWYESGLSADEALIIGSMFNKDGHPYASKMPGHALVATNAPYVGLAKNFSKVVKACRYGGKMIDQTNQCSHTDIMRKLYPNSPKRSSMFDRFGGTDIILSHQYFNEVLGNEK